MRAPHAQTPPARVAHTGLPSIHEVDGPPITHTARGWQHAWTVTDGIEAAAPVSFAENKISPVVAVSALCAVALTATVAALVTVTAGHPDQARIVSVCLGALGLFGVVVAVPALARAAARLVRSSR